MNIIVLQIRGLHLFGELLHQSFHRTQENADRTAHEKLEQLKAAEDPEYHNSFQVTTYTATLYL